MNECMKWMNFDDDSLTEGKKYLFLFSNGGLKILRYTQNHPRGIVAYCEIPPVPKSIVESYQKKRFEGAIKSYEMFLERDCFKNDTEGREQFLDDIAFVSRYIKTHMF